MIASPCVNASKGARPLQGVSAICASPLTKTARARPVAMGVYGLERPLSVKGISGGRNARNTSRRPIATWVSRRTPASDIPAPPRPRYAVINAATQQSMQLVAASVC